MRDKMPVPRGSTLRACAAGQRRADPVQARQCDRHRRRCGHAPRVVGPRRAARRRFAPPRLPFPLERGPHFDSPAQIIERGPATGSRRDPDRATQCELNRRRRCAGAVLSLPDHEGRQRSCLDARPIGSLKAPPPYPSEGVRDSGRSIHKPDAVNTESVFRVGPLGIVAVDSSSSIDRRLKAQPCEIRSAEFGQRWSCYLTRQYAQ
jgi:hypothetical protein